LCIDTIDRHFLTHFPVQTSKKHVSFTVGTVGQRFLLIKNVGKIKNVKKRVKKTFYIYAPANN